MAPAADSESDYEDPDYDPSGYSKQSKHRSNPNTTAATATSTKKKKAATAYASKDGQGYAWEEEYKRSWDVLREDGSGSLEGAVNQLMANKRKRFVDRLCLPLTLGCEDVADADILNGSIGLKA